MAKIRSLALSDIHKINKLISFTDIGVNSFLDGIVFPYPLTMLYKILPMRLKFMPESYVLFDKKELLAYISIKKHHNCYKKWKLSKLLMANNAYEAGLILIQYTISKLGAKGANTFLAEIEETQGELIRLFTEGAGFRQCSRHQIWKYNDTDLGQVDPLYDLSFRPFKNSDAKNVANLFNEAILTHFRPSLSQDKREYYDNIFSGLSANSEFKYIFEVKKTKQIIGYFSIRTTDNKNYLTDVILSKGYEDLFERALKYGLKLVRKRTKNATFFVLNRYYLQTANHYEQVLQDKNFSPSTSTIMLVKDLFRTANAEAIENKAVFYTDIHSTPVFKSF